ncbi:MAG TPA: hypothetical protein VFZ59_14500 [Verrucomicrobiae bacterium]|nr:hypothetical protein [Verrucomicrobiae bacterium]
MSAPETGAESTSSRRSWLFWLPLFFAVFYVLSPGPAFKLATYIKGMDPALKTVYAPLELLDEKVPAVHAFYNWYFRLWGAFPGQKSHLPKP